MNSKLYFSIFFAIVIGLSVYYSIKKILNAEKNNKINSTTYQSLLVSQFLPIAFFVSVIFICLEMGIKNGIFVFIQMCINLIVTFTLYYMFMLIILRVLRNKLHPLMISSLWMLPNFLYFIVLYRLNFLSNSIYYLTIDIKLAYILFSIWMFGFIFIMSLKTIEHFHFRKEILKDSVDIIDENILMIYEFEKEKLKLDRFNLELKKSMNISTPLTIGIRNKVIVFPNRYYTDEELHLILRHELIHISRADIMTKLLLVFANALCWFNPLMWIANKKCSEDLELSCDLSVLSNENEIIKRKYANLILKTANCEKGFTTCLSANGKVLQYRLKNIMNVSNKSLGLILVFILTFFVAISWGNVGIVIKGYNGYEDLFDSKEVVITNVYPNSYNGYSMIKDGEKIINYLSNIELYKISSDIISTSENSLILDVKDDYKEYRIHLHDNYIKVSNQYYLVKEGIDWEMIDQNVIYFPSLTINLYQNGINLNKNATTNLEKIETKDSIIYESNVNQFYDYINYYPSHIILEVDGSIASDIKVFETTENGVNNYIIPIDSDYKFETPKKDVDYQVIISYKIDEQIYDITYKFDFTYVEGISLDETILNKK